MSRLSRLIRKAAPLATLAAPLLGGPTNPFGLAATAIATLGAPRPQAQPTFTAPPSQFLPQIGGGALTGNLGLALSGLGRVGGAMLGVARTVGGKIRGVFMSSGKFVSRKKAAALAKRVGIEAAALALAISTVEMAEIILDESTAPRRGKGITARNIRTTKRVIGAVQRIHCRLGLRKQPVMRKCA